MLIVQVMSFLCFIAIIPFSMITMGAVHMNQCSVGNTPVKLLVGGLVWVVEMVLIGYSAYRHNQAEQAVQTGGDIQAPYCLLKLTHFGLLLFLFAWLLNSEY